MASPTELLQEIQEELGDLPEKLTAALKERGSAGPAPMLSTGQRVPLPMAGQQSPPNVRQPEPSSFPMPQPLSLPSSFPSVQSPPLPQSLPPQSSPTINPITVPSGQAMPTGLPSASMPMPTTPSAGLFGMAGLFGKAGAANEDRNDERIIELLEDANDKLELLVTAQQRVSADSTLHMDSGKPEKPSHLEPGSTQTKTGIDWAKLFRGRRA